MKHGIVMNWEVLRQYTEMYTLWKSCASTRRNISGFLGLILQTQEKIRSPRSFQVWVLVSLTLIWATSQEQASMRHYTRWSKIGNGLRQQCYRVLKTRTNHVYSSPTSNVEIVDTNWRTQVLHEWLSKLIFTADNVREIRHLGHASDTDIVSVWRYLHIAIIISFLYDHLFCTIKIHSPIYYFHSLHD